MKIISIFLQYGTGKKKVVLILVQHVPDSARHFALGYLMKVPVASAAILNVFCLSVWLVDTCLGASSYTLTDLSLPPIPTPHPPSHPSIPDHFPSGFRHSSSLSPFFQLSFLRPLSSSLLPTAPFISHLSISPPLFLPSPHSFIFTLSILTLVSFSFPCCSSSFPQSFTFQYLPHLPCLTLLSLPDENAGHVHGTQAGGDRNWPSVGRWRGMTLRDVNLSSMDAPSRCWKTRICCALSLHLPFYINAFSSKFHPNHIPSVMPRAQTPPPHMQSPVRFVLITDGETKTGCTCNQSCCQRGSRDSWHHLPCTSRCRASKCTPWAECLFVQDFIRQAADSAQCYIDRATRGHTHTHTHTLSLCSLPPSWNLGRTAGYAFQYMAVATSEQQFTCLVFF